MRSIVRGPARGPELIPAACWPEQDRYAVLVSDLAWYEKADKSQLQAPVRAVLARGIESGALRHDLSAEVLNELLGGSALSAIKLTQHQKLGVEEASAAAASLFLDGARPR